MYFYIISLAIFLLVSLVLQIVFRERLFDSLKAYIFLALIFLTIGTIWDVYAISNQHWVFTGKGLLGIYIGSIPLEDFLWFLIIPYFWLVLYKVNHTIFDKHR